jgi:hypothetical protein
MARQDTERKGRSLAGRSAERERQRGGGFRAIGEPVSRVARPIAASAGGGLVARLKTAWAAAIGAELAAICWPEALSRDGALRLRCAPGFGLDLQHCTPLVIERINLFFGRAAVSRVALVQGPLPLAAPRQPAIPPQPLTQAEQQALDQRLSGVADPELRDALARLGQSLLLRGTGRE